MMRFSAGTWLPLIRRIEAASQVVALSIDDGPNPDTTPSVLHALKAADATATFFLTGIRAAQFPELVADIVRDGHPVFAHGWEHVSLAKAAPEQIIDAMQRSEALLSRYRPTPSPYLVRLPYGAGHRSQRVHRALRVWQPNCQIAHWTLLFEDYRLVGLCSNPEEVSELCVGLVEEALSSCDPSGSILVCHDAPFGTEGRHKALVTMRFIETVLSALAKRELQIVPIRPSVRRHVVGRCILL